MTRTDYKKELKHLYSSSSREVVIVDVPPMNFLMLDGEGDPNKSLEFVQSVDALYALSYTLKFIIKKRASIDYGVMPLEGLWQAGASNEFNTENKGSWKWTVMIMQPGYVTDYMVAGAMDQVRKKKNTDIVDRIRFESYHEGLSAQIMHLGPYSEEGPTVEKIHTFIQKNGFYFNGKHHEIYLSDPRRARPDKMRTIIRQPVYIKRA